MIPDLDLRLPPLAARAPAVLTDDESFTAALTVLGATDPSFMATLERAAARPALRRREAGFEGLAWIVVSQQVSTAAADAIFSRLKLQLGVVEAEAIIAANDAGLRLCGLSAPKIRTVRALADAVTTRRLDLAALPAMDAESAHDALCAIKGIGPWTADIFLLFCLGHADAWPTGDLALQEAARLALALDERPDAKSLLAIGERWRPLRGVAAHCLWAYYHATRGRPAPLTASQTRPTPPVAAAKQTARSRRP